MFVSYFWHVFSLFVHQIYRIVFNQANNRSLFLLKHCYKKVIEEGRGTYYYIILFIRYINMCQTCSLAKISVSLHRTLNIL